MIIECPTVICYILSPSNKHLKLDIEIDKPMWVSNASVFTSDYYYLMQLELNMKVFVFLLVNSRVQTRTKAIFILVYRIKTREKKYAWSCKLVAIPVNCRVDHRESAGLPQQ